MKVELDVHFELAHLLGSTVSRIKIIMVTYGSSDGTHAYLMGASGPKT